MSILVVGAGISGHGAARLARRRGMEAVVYDRDPETLSDLAQEGFRTLGGEWTTDALREAEVVVLSPGVAEHTPPVRDAIAAGLDVWSELEFASRHTELPILAVTGTNGKTTTTGLVSDMLTRSGKKAATAGNIGIALSDVVDEPWEVLVVEASSFQLRFIESFRPRIAVVLNVAEDHLDWHRSVAAYRESKARICENQRADDLLVFGADDEGATLLASRARARTRPVSGRHLPVGGAGVEEGRLHLGDLVLPIGVLAVSDPAYLVDLAAAGLAALEAGAELAAVEMALLAFRPAAHRRTVVGEWRGVLWVDDSKATNPHAAIASIRSYPCVVLLAGGRNKGLDLTDMVRQPNLKAVVALGEARDEIMEAASVPSVAAETIEEAVAFAFSLADPGDTVLLAPGCASFDMFESYAARGEAFGTAVRSRAGAAWPR